MRAEFSVAGEHADHARRQPDLLEHVGEEQRVEWGFGCRFEHDAAAGEQGGHQLGGDQKLGHVPGHDRGHHTDRLVPDVEVGAEEAGPNLLPRIAFRDIAEGAHHHQGEPNLCALSERDGRTEFGADRLGHLGFAFAVELRQPTHGVESLGRCRPRPRAVIEGETGRGNGRVDVSRPGRGDAGHDRLRMR